MDGQMMEWTTSPLSSSPILQVLILFQEALHDCSNQWDPSIFFNFYSLAPGYILYCMYKYLSLDGSKIFEEETMSYMFRVFTHSFIQQVFTKHLFCVTVNVPDTWEAVNKTQAPLRQSIR